MVASIASDAAADARWNAWQARGIQQDRVVGRNMAILVMVLALVLVVSGVFLVQ